MKNIDEHVSILRVPVFSGTFDAALSRILASLKSSDKKMLIVFTPNPEQVVLAQQRPRFRAALSQAGLCVPDGIGLVFAGKVLGFPLPEKIAGIDLAAAAVQHAVKFNLPTLFIGGRDQSAAKAAAFFGSPLITSKAGAADIAHETKAEVDQILERVAKTKPALVLIAYGAPWQELWVVAHQEELKAFGVRVVMVVGGAFDIWAQKIQRAPLQWRKNGWEWLWRLMHEPWRWRRQLRLLAFVWYVLRARLGKRERITL